MSEKRFVYHNEHFSLNVREIVDNENGETYDCEGATDVLNELFDKNKELKEENEQLQKQIQNYEQLLSNSYVGEEERLDGFVGKYVIWEDELQKYKNKNEMIDNG